MAVNRERARDNGRTVHGEGRLSVRDVRTNERTRWTRYVGGGDPLFKLKERWRLVDNGLALASTAHGPFGLWIWI